MASSISMSVYDIASSSAIFQNRYGLTSSVHESCTTVDLRTIESDIRSVGTVG